MLKFRSSMKAMGAAALLGLGALSISAPAAFAQDEEEVIIPDDQLEAAFEALLFRMQAAEIFATQQERVLARQDADILTLTDEVSQVPVLKEQSTEIMLKMIADLEDFVATDLPFKAQDRQDRLARLRDAMSNPDFTDPDRYRLIVEAYTAEMEYGNTIATWKEDIRVGDAEIKVDMLQYGRVALVYVTPDRDGAARYDRATGEWQPLPNSYVADIVQAIRAQEGKAPQIIFPAPVQKFEVAQ